MAKISIFVPAMALTCFVSFFVVTFLEIHLFVFPILSNKLAEGMRLK